jgi:uncharacterized lipoprotein
MKNKLIVASLLVVLLLSACGYKEGIHTAAQKSYLYFTGNIQSALVSVDGGAQFPVKPGKDNLYSISPGKHKVLVVEGGTILVERDIYVGDGVAKEILVQ